MNRPETMNPTPTKPNFALGLLGCISGLLAMTAAFLSPWIAEAFDLPVSLEQTVRAD
jgi:hypothetical protein